MPYSTELTADNVHVWTMRTETCPSVLAQGRKILADSERDRAERFLFDHLREAFIVTRSALRVLLGAYRSVDPASIQFRYGSRGKPHLVDSAGIHFNVSHTSGLAVFAFGREREIGIDVEKLRSIPDLEGIANRFFCPEEAEEVISTVVEDRQEAFFRCWTRKEAYIKAVGDGLSVPLDSFRVAIKPDAPVRFIHIGRDIKKAAAWKLHDLKPCSQYLSALAYAGVECAVRVFPPIEAAALIASGHHRGGDVTPSLSQGQPISFLHKDL